MGLRCLKFTSEDSWNCNILELRRDARAWENNVRSLCEDLKTETMGNMSPPRETLQTERRKEPK